MAKNLTKYLAISLEVLREHFQKLNEGPSDQTDTTPFSQDNTDEVSEIIRKLQNNKSCVMDQIINEHLHVF